MTTLIAFDSDYTRIQAGNELVLARLRQLREDGYMTHEQWRAELHGYFDTFGRCASMPRQLEHINATMKRLRSYHCPACDNMRYTHAAWAGTTRPQLCVECCCPACGQLYKDCECGR